MRYDRVWEDIQWGISSQHYLSPSLFWRIPYILSSFLCFGESDLASFLCFRICCQEPSLFWRISVTKTFPCCYPRPGRRVRVWKQTKAKIYRWPVSLLVSLYSQICSLSPSVALPCTCVQGECMCILFIFVGHIICTYIWVYYTLVYIETHKGIFKDWFYYVVRQWHL